MSKEKPKGIPLAHFLKTDSFSRSFERLLKEEPNEDNQRLKNAFFDEIRNTALSDESHRAEIKNRRVAGGITTSQQKKEQTKKRNDDIEGKAVQLRAGGRPERNIASILSQRFNLSVRQIRAILTQRNFYRR